MVFLFLKTNPFLKSKSVFKILLGLCSKIKSGLSIGDICHFSVSSSHLAINSRLYRASFTLNSVIFPESAEWGLAKISIKLWSSKPVKIGKIFTFIAPSVTSIKPVGFLSLSSSWIKLTASLPGVLSIKYASLPRSIKKLFLSNPAHTLASLP